MRIKKTYIVGALVLIAIIAIAARFFFGNKRSTDQTASAFGSIGASTDASGTTSANVATEPQQVPTDCGQPSGDTCAQYQSSAYHFSLYHSDKQVVNSYDEGGGAQTLTFQDVAGANGFQIYVLPYSDTQVSEERFKMDEPSGVRDNVRNATVGGAGGAAFYSKNTALGDTYEVWFIHGGYLYEVTTLKALEPMLNSILATWRFN